MNYGILIIIGIIGIIGTAIIIVLLKKAADKAGRGDKE